MFRLAPFLFLLFGAACTSQVSTRSEKRDSIMQMYFSVIDSLRDFDTLNEDYRLLKAYYTHDTNHLKKECRKLSDRHYMYRLDPKTKCAVSPPLQSGNHDNAYRFYYRSDFCDSSILCIISRSGTEVSAQYYLFHDYNEISDCIPIRHTIRKLTIDDWDLLTETVYLVNFWGLMPYDGVNGFDGSNFWLSGYRKNEFTKEQEVKNVYRWAAEGSGLNFLFTKAFLMSGVQNETLTNLRFQVFEKIKL